MPDYISVPNCLGNSSVVTQDRIVECAHHDAYDARVVVTIPFSKKEQHLCPLKNHPKFVFIHHHAEASAQHVSKCNGVSREILKWNNSYVAGDQMFLRHIFPLEKLYTPSHMSISPAPLFMTETTSQTLPPPPPPSSSQAPSLALSTMAYSAYHKRPPPLCVGHQPTAILQGEISRRRNLWELELIINASASDVHIKVLTRSPPLRNWTSKSTWNGEWLRTANMTHFHESFQGAAFLLAGMSPQNSQTKAQNYFLGHQSSNIAYALHFGLQIIGHKAIKKHYVSLGEFEGREPIGFWHDGSKTSIKETTLRAIASWKRRCLPSSL